MTRTAPFHPVHAGATLRIAWVLVGITASMMLWPSLLQANEGRQSPIVQAVTQARPSVVSIHGRKRVANTTTVTEGRQVNGMGTGVVVDQRGYILTNYHVVEGVERIQVTTADERTFIGRLVAHDESTDLAVIKIDAQEDLPVIVVGSSHDLMPGETVIAVGNAYGYDHTVTSGIISALHRPVQVSDTQKYNDLIQTDASINPGNSGGPLLNINGDMIGLNVAVRVGAQGIGFAIPVNEAMRVAAGLLTVENIERKTHGVLAVTLDDTVPARLEVRSSRTNSPAEKAGLRPGDIIERVGDVPVERKLDFERALIGRADGEEIALRIRRNNESLDVSLVLETSPRLSGSVTDRAWNVLGVRVSPVSQRVIRQLNARYRGGLKVDAVRANSPAAEQGIQRGDVLVGVHKWETVSLDNISYILNSRELWDAQPAKFYILRGGETLFGQLMLR